MESVAGIKWNGWPEWNGIGGRDRLEYSELSFFTSIASKARPVGARKEAILK